MYLQRIELQGFKSFAQKTVLEFPTPGKGCGLSPNISHDSSQLSEGICGVASIVGPNGSGKSNIVDAVRWVLGEQSLKLLRGKKSTDVIFSGSAKRGQMGMAEVSLYLNNEDKSAPIDYTEVVITRKIYRDGSSEYLLNKNQVRLFDIIMLLAKANFGQNTYSVIGQGMVDIIVNYSSQDRKNFFDEATGVKQFQIKRDRSVNKLKKSRENLGQAQNLIQELDPHLKSLTRQVNRLQKRKEIEVELRDLQIKYYGKIWMDLDSNYQNLVISFTAKEKEKLKLEDDIYQLQKIIDRLGQEKSRGEEFNSLQSEYNKQIERRNNLLKSIAEIKGKLDVEYLKIGKQDLTWLENRKDDIESHIRDLSNEIEDIDKKNNRYQEVLNEKLQQQKKAISEFGSLEEKLLQSQKEFSSELGISEKEIRQSINRIYSLYKDFVIRIKKVGDLESLDKIKIEASIIFSEVEGFYKKISQEEKKIQSDEVLWLQNKMSLFLKSKDLLVNEINEVKIKLEVANSQKKSLKIKVADLNTELLKVKNDLAKNQLDPQKKEKIHRDLDQEKADLEKQIYDLEKLVKGLKIKIDNFNEEEEKKKQEIFNIQQRMHGLQINLNQVVIESNDNKVSLAKIETKKEDLFVSMRQSLGENYRPKMDSSFKDIDLDDYNLKIDKLKKKLELIGGTDPEVELEYQEVKERYDFLTKESGDLEKAINDLEKIVVELDKMIKKQFESEFTKINKDFSRYFKKLFDGGNAKLVLSQKDLTEAEEVREQIAESAEPNEEEESQEEKKETHIEDKSELSNMGIDIEACPPGKKIKNISSLSGGEKTMTALALICSIIYNNPSPFILFDEVDAALDENNSNKFSDIVQELSYKTQFITITHNRAIMARASVLYGVTMQGDGVSRLISLKLEEAKEIVKK